MNNMDTGVLTDDFNDTIDVWIKALTQYNFRQLCIQPVADSWSLGQVYVHLINATHYFIEQIKTCLSTNDHAMEETSDAAKAMFLNNSFPDKRLEGPPSNAYTPQPESKEQLMSGLIQLKNDIGNVGSVISKSSFKGKTKHPGLNYFNAHQWLQFAEMHFRHHLRQKQRIEAFLNMNNID